RARAVDALDAGRDLGLAEGRELADLDRPARATDGQPAQLLGRQPAGALAQDADRNRAPAGLPQLGLVGGEAVQRGAQRLAGVARRDAEVGRARPVDRGPQLGLAVVVAVLDLDRAGHGPHRLLDPLGERLERGRV